MARRDDETGDLDDGDVKGLWRISAFERQRRLDEAVLGRSTLVGSSLLGELERIDKSPWRGDVLEVLAASLRQNEPALLYLGHRGSVWPVTVFPREGLYHCPRDLLDLLTAGARDLTVLSVEPPGVRPPGHAQSDRISAPVFYRPLPPMLWALALHGPRAALLDDLAGSVAYRVTAQFRLGTLALPAAYRAAWLGLQRAPMNFAALAALPGMNDERAQRLLNALYLQHGLMVLRSAAMGADGPGWWSRWRSRWQGR